MKQGIFMRDIVADSKDAIIDIVGIVGWEVSYMVLLDMLRKIPDTVERVIFEIYSPGGDVWEGNAIIQAIGALKQNTVARVQVAASMATSIAVACKERTIARNGRWLIHNPWAAIQGDAADMEKRAKELRDCEQEAAKFYAERTGQPVKKMVALMDEERWLTPTEAQELGFVQAIEDPFDAASFAGVKAEIEAAGKWPKALMELSPEPSKTEPDKKEPKTAESFDCECIKCGNTITSETHCKDLKCEKCGGQMRRKERPGPGQGGEDGNASSKGAEGDGKAPPNESGKPTNDTSPEASGTFGDGYAKGRIDADTDHAGKLTEILAAMTALKKSNADLDAQQRRFQGERDSARAQVEKLNAALSEATAKIERFLTGGMSFAPSIETWADALKASNDDYELARRKYPELFRAERESQKAKRK
jgi:ATP-dependent protease ClpP protease subunit